MEILIHIFLFFFVESPLATTSTSFNSSGLQSASSFNSPTTSAHSSYVLESRSNSVAELLVSNKCMFRPLASSPPTIRLFVNFVFFFLFTLFSAVLNCCTMIDIGQEQYRTRTARSKTPNPFWGEDFTMYVTSPLLSYSLAYAFPSFPLYT